MSQLSGESIALFFGRKVAVLPPPSGNSLHHPIDDLAQRGLPPRRPEPTTEIFLRDYVDRGL